MITKADDIRKMYSSNPASSNKDLQDKLAKLGIKVTSGQIIGVIGRQGDRYVDQENHHEFIRMADDLICQLGTYDKALTYLKIARVCPTQSNRIR